MVMVMEMKMVISIVIESGLLHFAKSFVTLCSTLPHKILLLSEGAVYLKLYIQTSVKPKSCRQIDLLTTFSNAD